MKTTRYLLFFILQICAWNGYAQDSSITWYNPVASVDSVLEGQGWRTGLENPYDRLPAKAHGVVREAVWNLSRQTAGMMIRFRSNASEIRIRYQVTGKMELPHMPATGVSGVDLYAVSTDGEQLWCAGKYAFKDTVSYQFANLNAHDPQHDLGREYRLYLPLYNGVKWLEIGVADTSAFTPLQARPEKAIVIYGTSIAQGACASRPGMAWTNILSRKLDVPLLNVAFSGNGRLEPELIDLIGEQDARMYVLDCLPNLTVRPTVTYTIEDVRQRILQSVRTLQQRRPGSPIILSEHAGYTDAAINPTSKGYYEEVNKVIRDAFAQLQQEGIKDLYLIPIGDFGQDIDTMVDGTHPNDLGMMRYAEGYERHIRTILAMPVGKVSTTIPVTQLRELMRYDWEKRHQEVLQVATQNNIETVVIGNSITHFWGGRPEGHTARGKASWNRTFGYSRTLNMGFGWDRIENVLWRVYHGELDGIKPKRILVQIGTNNLHLNSDEEIVAGWDMLVDAIRHRQPNAQLYLVGVFPRRKDEERIRVMNEAMNRLATAKGVSFIDPGKVFLKNGKIDEGWFSDGLHPNTQGYDLLGKEYTRLLKP